MIANAKESGLASPAADAREIGIADLPAKWRVAPLGDFLIEAQYGLSVKGGPEGRCPILRMTNQVNGRIKAEKLQYADVTDKQLQSHRVAPGDLLFNRTNSLELVGRTAIFDLPGDYVFASYLIRLRAKADDLDPEFLNFYLGGEETQKRLKGIATRAISQSNISATRLKGFPVPLPPLPEQKKIAHILSTVQRAIEEQERIIQTTTELRKALMLKLFTEGTRGEKQKESEIGPIPVSWEVAKINDHCIDSAFGPRFGSELYAADGNILTLRTTDMEDDGRIDYNTAPLARIEHAKFEKHYLQIGDIVVSRSGTCGIASVFEGYSLPVLPGAFLIRLRMKDSVQPMFLRHYINSPVGRPYVLQLAQGAIQKNISGTRLGELLIPLPSRSEQKVISAAIGTIDQRLANHRQKQAVNQDLFRTLLHELMIAKTRVDELESPPHPQKWTTQPQK